MTPWDSRVGGGTTPRTLQQIEASVLDYTDAHAGGRVPGFLFADLDYGIRFDNDDANAAANTAAFNQAFTDMQTPVGGAGGGVLLCPHGIAKVNNTISLRNGCTLRGIWKGGSQVRAATTFPINTPVVRLGDGVHDLGLTFGCRLEYMSVHANSIAGSTCVYTADCQEGSGLFHVGLFSHKLYGAHFDTSGCSQYACEELEVYGDGCTAGIYMHSNAGTNTIHWATVSDSAGIGIRCDGGGYYNLKQIHIEGPGDGIYANGNVAIDGILGNGSNVYLVHITGITDHVTVENLYTEGSTHAIKDDLAGFTIDDVWVGYYSQRGIQVGQSKLSSPFSGATVPASGGTAGEVKINAGPAAIPAAICHTPGSWRPLAMSPTVTDLAYSSSMTPGAHIAIKQRITVTNATAMTINAPTNPILGEDLTFDIINSSGGAMGAITWNAVFKLAGAFTNPANTKRRTITFYYDGTSWIETTRAAADI